MFKKIGIILLIFSFIIIFQNESRAFWFQKRQNIIQPPKEFVFAPVNIIEGNRVWTGTFQLVWNDLQNEILKMPIEFSGTKSELADDLNKQGFNSSLLSFESYYKKYGQISLKLKKEIEQEIEKKFNEKSSILDSVNWNSDGMLVYAMLKKDFKFQKEFKMLSLGEFGDKKVKFFGISKNSDEAELRNNVSVLFYNSPDDYAVKLNTLNNEEVILYRTDETKKFEEYFKDLDAKSSAFDGDTAFQKEDSIKIPVVKIDEMFEYKELEHKPIKGTDYIIDSAVQTVEFKMDNKGGSLKSEAGLIMRMSLAPEIKGRDFIFNNSFVLMLKEKDKSAPYFIADFKTPAFFEKAD